MRQGPTAAVGKVLVPFIWLHSASRSRVKLHGLTWFKTACSGLQDREGGAPEINGKFLENGERGTKYVSTAKKDEVIEMVREQRVKGLQRATRGVAYDRG